MRTRPIQPHEMKLFSEYHAQFAVSIVYLTEEDLPEEDLLKIVNETRPSWAGHKVKDLSTDPAEWRKEHIRLLKWALKRLEGGPDPTEEDDTSHNEIQLKPTDRFIFVPPITNPGKLTITNETDQTVQLNFTLLPKQPVTNPYVKYIKSGNEDLEQQGWKGPGWYFWDETEAFCHGPYPSFDEAQEGLNKYVQALKDELR